MTAAQNDRPSDPQSPADDLQDIEAVSRLTRIIELQADELLRKDSELARAQLDLRTMHESLPFQVGELLVDGLTSRAAARQVPRRSRAIARRVRAALRYRRMSKGASPKPSGSPVGPIRTEPFAWELRLAQHNRERLHGVRPKDLVVALVCDEFTYNSFSPEFVAVPLNPHDWREQMERHSPHLLLVESAWSGIDSVARPWRGKVYASPTSRDDNRGTLVEILNFCRRRGLPTAFWNKEDPTHFDDRKRDFVATARLFDHVFTTAEECVDRYRHEQGCPSVSVLPFASQPRLFNPFGAGQRTRDVVFAGSWYTQHVERSAQMGRILDRILDHGMTLKIYDRNFGCNDPNHLFPTRFQPLLNPAVPHSMTAQIYRESEYGLNINTVTTSRTMFARRVFELMSSGTLVLSNHSVGVEEMFKDLVVFVDRDPWVLDDLADHERAAMRRRALLEVLARHTYADRFDQIVREMGISPGAPAPSTTFVHRIESVNAVEVALSNFQRGRRPHDRLLLVPRGEVDPPTAARLDATHELEDVDVLDVSHLARNPLIAPADVSSTHVALMDERPYPDRETLDEALAHARYLCDAWVRLERTGEYTVHKHTPGDRLLGPAERLGSLLLSGERIVEGVVHGF